MRYIFKHSATTVLLRMPPVCFYGGMRLFLENRWKNPSRSQVSHKYCRSAFFLAISVVSDNWVCYNSTCQYEHDAYSFTSISFLKSYLHHFQAAGPPSIFIWKALFYKGRCLTHALKHAYKQYGCINVLKRRKNGCRCLTCKFSVVILYEEMEFCLNSSISSSYYSFPFLFRLCRSLAFLPEQEEGIFLSQ